MKQTNEIQIDPLGDSALVVQFADEVNEESHEKVMGFIRALEKDPFEGFLEAVPTYTNVTVFYNPLLIKKDGDQQQTVFENVRSTIENYISQNDGYTNKQSNTVEIPLLYGDEFGPDLEYVAENNHLSIEEVIQIHSKNDYLVYMIGFTPGFPFLGGMDERIEAPRKETPRTAIPAGSVGIAGKQTGIYPFESPGGWQIIGRTPVDLFLPENNPPTLIKPGDHLRFVPIDQEEYMKRKEE